MKFRFVLVFFIICNYLYGEGFNNYDEQHVFTFSTGSMPGEIGLIEGVESKGNNELFPKLLKKYKDYFILFDTVNSRVNFYNVDFSLEKELEVDFRLLRNSKSKIMDNIIFSSGYNKFVTAFNISTGNITELNFPDSISSKDRVLFTDKVIFNYMNDGSLCSFVLVDEDEMKYSRLLNEEETLELFNEKDKYLLNGYTIDAKRRIFFKNHIQNNDFITLYNYWVELHDANNMTPPRIIPGVPDFEKLSGITSPFIGFDLSRNSYWSSKTGIIIFDSNGWVLDYLKFNNFAYLGPTINEDGDIYYATSEKVNGVTVFNTYKIPRQW
ncbi:hypothetical protein EW093_05575 [Thiospirochaeta perfilievii]|uniref:Uncharacterized protein n=1 Tax=Thiospirochaeta perfilievii TaxID=252967 RepID=A0A5C1Q828_9SPIO|nr:hypothetical protein [Thiospirochaeta perfilievii]QEN04195.1 hypothetical protein EW093_05575 [Thiospirochaeta perfilievii]